MIAAATTDVAETKGVEVSETAKSPETKIVKSKKEVKEPANWRDVYEKIRGQRLETVAAVDTMGWFGSFSLFSMSPIVPIKVL